MNFKKYHFALLFLFAPILVLKFNFPSLAERSYQFGSQQNNNSLQNLGDNNGTQQYINQFEPTTQNFDSRGSSHTQHNGNFYEDSLHYGNNNNGTVPKEFFEQMLRLLVR